jgi:hypothetical protein
MSTPAACPRRVLQDPSARSLVSQAEKVGETGKASKLWRLLWEQLKSICPVGPHAVLVCAGQCEWADKARSRRAPEGMLLALVAASTRAVPTTWRPQTLLGGLPGAGMRSTKRPCPTRPRGEGRLHACAPRPERRREGNTPP